TPLAILYGTTEAEGAERKSKSDQWGGRRVKDVRICQKCRKASGIQVICQHCLTVQDDHPLYGKKDDEGHIYDPEGNLVETLPAQAASNLRHLDRVPDVLDDELDEVPLAPAPAAREKPAPPSVDISIVP